MCIPLTLQDPNPKPEAPKTSDAWLVPKALIEEASSSLAEEEARNGSFPKSGDPNIDPKIL